MNGFRWIVLLTVALIMASASVYSLQVMIFHRTEDTLFYLFQDLAFLPINALLVVIILEKLLKWHEKQSRLKKMNIVIGVFFSEIGIKLLSMFVGFEKAGQEILSELRIGERWSDSEFENAKKNIKNFKFVLDAMQGNLHELHDIFVQNQSLILTLMENPNLLEHESFTNMLLAVSHLRDELAIRRNLTTLSPKDALHISVDMQRAYSALVSEWLGYMNHLKKEYPYLYSLAVRTNPFNPEVRPEID
jgi:hypothetical protein